jgi:hypothetical protein
MRVAGSARRPTASAFKSPATSPKIFR